MGTKTKIVAALLVLINVLVLVNLRVPLSRVGRKYSLSRKRGRKGNNETSGSTNDASEVWAGDGGWRRPQGSPPQTKRHKPGEVVVVFPSVGPDVEEHGSGDGREPVKSALQEEAEEEEECRDMVESLKIIPNKSWGKAEKPQQLRWELLNCNAVVERKKARRTGPIDCTSRPSQPSDPLIAICAGTTTRGVPILEEHSLALFRFLLPSLGRTAECGFNYIAVIGYDVGDEFFDAELGKERVMAWFDAEVKQPAASRGLKIQLELVRVENKIQKPGPVFTATTKVAYDRGANYTYRVNDDSEMVDPWAGKFVKVLKDMGPPYGVVGPESLNNNILVHDFTHRLHMDIFEGQYYPESLTDWYIDDWISRVYGRRRTVRVKNCKVEHHTGAHGQRYNADTSKARTVDGLVKNGAKRIVRWAELNGAEQAAQDLARDSLDGRSAKKYQARFIP